LFDSILVFENYPVDASLGNYSSSLKIVDAHAVEQTNYPLTLLASSARRMSFSLLFDSSLYREQTAARLLSQLQALIEALAWDSQRQLQELPPLSESEREQVLCEWNDTNEQYESRLIPELVRRQAQRTAAAIAVESEQAAISYQELDRKSNQLANYLIEKGV